MSEQKQVSHVPDGKTPYYTTRQLPATDKGFVGYETIWKPMQIASTGTPRRAA